jgi:hypothetical protein
VVVLAVLAAKAVAGPVTNDSCDLLLFPPLQIFPLPRLNKPENSAQEWN